MAMPSTHALTREKTHGRIYTPAYIVENILDLCGYRIHDHAILGRHVIDNSCGDGAFLVEVVRRYGEAAQAVSMPVKQLRNDLSRYVHGMEIDADECKKCIANVTAVAKTFGVGGVDWDIHATDALVSTKYNGKMDYVVGNPPYVRVHNLVDKYDAVKEFSFAQNGMTDLFIVFYEIGLRMLNENGVLGYISPSSLFNSLAGATMRTQLSQRRHIKAVVDLKHFQPFEATTYTTIMILAQSRQDTVAYYAYDEGRRLPSMVSTLAYEDFCINNAFVFGPKEALDKLKKIAARAYESLACEVKNGFATLYDAFFIGDRDFGDHTIPVIKASTGKWRKCLYPYDRNGKLFPYETLSANPAIRSHYESHAEKLKSRSLDHPDLWHGFGRSQGINDVYRKKYAINALIRDAGDIKLSACGPGMGVYSGLYILTDVDEDELKRVLFTEEFTAYVTLLGKYKSGGYYTYSSKDVQRFLNYAFSERGGRRHEQLRLY